MSTRYPPAPVSGLAPPPAPAAWGVADAALAAKYALTELRLDAGDLTLVRDVSTVVFQLVERTGSWAVKVHPPGTDVARQLAVYRALDGTDVCLHPLAGPVETPYGAVTLWPWADAVHPVSWPEIGALLRELHRVAAEPSAVPAWRPLSRLPAQVAGLATEHAGVLLDARSRLLAAAAALTSDLGHGLIHGDVSVENTLRRPGGAPAFIDLDFVAWGPREYDLVGAHLRALRGEISRSAYDGFCTAYGADPRDWAGLATVVEICELGALTFEVWAAAHSGTTVPGLDARIDRWR